MGRLKGERFELVTLHSGTRAIRERRSGEVMHPAVGPWAEACALYVDQLHLRERLCDGAGEPLVIFDVGLGGAANAAAAITCARSCGGGRRRTLELLSFEVDTEPLKLALDDPEGFPFLRPLADAARTLLDQGVWEEDGVRWTLRPGDALKALESEKARAELIFHDPFSPETNPALWTPEAFALLRSRARQDERGCLLATYSASTRTRASMLLGGWNVGVGAATGFKKETTVAATRRALLSNPLGPRWLERWQRSSARAPWGRDTLSAEEEALITRAIVPAL
ncbi:MAG: methyltransferase [Myxococcaceae bacterium]|nr:methyltransferase [Myxococcaceae bacterium]